MIESRIEEIIEANRGNRKAIIPILQEIQAVHNYLPEKELRLVAEKLAIPLIDLYSIASFYSSFSLRPRGKHVVQVCQGTACHVRGARQVLDETKKRLKIEPNETTEDLLFSLKTVNCLGACALGPIVVVDDKYHSNTRAQKVGDILAHYTPHENKGGNA